MALPQVGYGDVGLSTDGGQAFAIVHILVSVSLLGDAIADFDNLRAKRAKDLKRGDSFKILNLEQNGKQVGGWFSVKKHIGPQTDPDFYIERVPLREELRRLKQRSETRMNPVLS